MMWNSNASFAIVVWAIIHRALNSFIKQMMLRHILHNWQIPVIYEGGEKYVIRCRINSVEKNPVDEVNTNCWWTACIRNASNSINETKYTYIDVQCIYPQKCPSIQRPCPRVAYASLPWWWIMHWIQIYFYTLKAHRFTGWTSVGRLQLITVQRLPNAMFICSLCLW